MVFLSMIPGVPVSSNIYFLGTALPGAKKTRILFGVFEMDQPGKPWSRTRANQNKCDDADRRDHRHGFWRADIGF